MLLFGLGGRRGGGRSRASSGAELPDWYEDVMAWDEALVDDEPLIVLLWEALGLIVSVRVADMPTF